LWGGLLARPFCIYRSSFYSY